VPHAVLQFHHALDDLRHRHLRFDDGVELYLTRNGFEDLRDFRDVFVVPSRGFLGNNSLIRDSFIRR
jgi:hypothetical protein